MMFFIMCKFLPAVAFLENLSTRSRLLTSYNITMNLFDLQEWNAPKAMHLKLLNGALNRVTVSTFC